MNLQTFTKFAKFDASTFDSKTALAIVAGIAWWNLRAKAEPFLPPYMMLTLDAGIPMYAAFAIKDTLTRFGKALDKNTDMTAQNAQATQQVVQQVAEVKVSADDAVDAAQKAAKVAALTTKEIKAELKEMSQQVSVASDGSAPSDHAVLKKAETIEEKVDEVREKIEEVKKIVE